MKSFREYLQEKCDESNSIDYSYHNWLSEQSNKDLITHAEGWMNETKSHITREVTNLLK